MFPFRLVLPTLSLAYTSYAREHDDMASDDMYDDEGEGTDDEAGDHDSVGEDHPVDHEW